MASAEADQTLTQILESVAFVGDYAWILLQGQSTEWLIQSIISVFKISGRPYRSTAEDVERVQQMTGKLKSLQNYRNVVIHGRWSASPLYSEPGGEDPEWHPRPRPWGTIDDEPIFYCHRTRLRKVPPDQELTITDVEHLASQIEQVDSELVEVLIKWRRT